MPDVADLPDDVEALKAMLRDAHIELRGRDLLIEKLKLQLSGMARHRFGSSAEGLQQLQLMAGRPGDHPQHRVSRWGARANGRLGWQVDSIA